MSWTVAALVLTCLEVLPEEPSPPPVQVSEYNAGMDVIWFEDVSTFVESE